MKYYATKIGTDSEGNPTVLKQIEVGVPLANYYEMRNVCDSSGNTYYSYGATICKVPVDIESIDEVVEINVNTALGLTGYEVLGIALNSDSSKLYILIATAYNATTCRLYTIDDLSAFTTLTLYKDLSGSALYPSNIICDKFENIWTVPSLGSAAIRRIDTELNITVFAHLSGRYDFIVCDIRGYIWILGGQDNDAQFRLIRNDILSDYPALVQNYIIDGCSWSNGTNHYIYALKNNMSDNTNACVLYIYNVTDYTTPTSSSISLLHPTTSNPLVQCYNLHTNSDGDVFFSTYSVADGYNTFKIAQGTTTIELYIAGLGSKTTGNDPYAFFVSQHGHTGANI